MSEAAPRLLATLLHRGVELAVVGDRLRYRPPDAVTNELRADLIRHKPELLSLIRKMAAPALATGTWARYASALLAQVSDDTHRVDLREAFEERAAICQYDGNLGIEDAERIAFVQLCRAVTSQAPVASASGAPAAVSTGANKGLAADGREGAKP